MFSKRFFIEYQVKNYLFGHFYRDTLDWITLYNLSLTREYQRMSIQSKQFIFIRMGIECILKAILIGLSKRNESAREVFKAARKCSHNIEKLINQCKARSGQRYRICSKATLDRLSLVNKLEINMRYDFDMKTIYKRQSFVERVTCTGPISGTVIDLNFHKELKSDLIELCELARRIRNARFSKHCTIPGDRFGELDEYLQSLVPQANKVNTPARNAEIAASSRQRRDSSQ